MKINIAKSLPKLCVIHNAITILSIRLNVFFNTYVHRSRENSLRTPHDHFPLTIINPWPIVFHLYLPSILSDYLHRIPKIISFYMKVEYVYFKYILEIGS